MFVTIRKPTKPNMLKVSMKQYENKYKRLGYMIVGDSMKTEEVEEPEHEVVEQNIIEEESEDIDSIPISEMNKEQLMRFAKVHNINTKSAKNVAEARRIIQRAVKEAKM
nr:MAG TPA: HeH/LEM domain [Caudoviricetes sp.]